MGLSICFWLHIRSEFLILKVLCLKVTRCGKKVWKVIILWVFQTPHRKTIYQFIHAPIHNGSGKESTLFFMWWWCTLKVNAFYHANMIDFHWTFEKKKLDFTGNKNSICKFLFLPQRTKCLWNEEASIKWFGNKGFKGCPFL